MEHHEVGSSTFFTIPAAVYLSRASFSLIGLATGTQCTGENFYLKLNWGSLAAKAFDVFRICLSMSSYVNFPVKPCVFWKGSLWVWRVRAWLAHHTDCHCWVVQDGSILLPWVCCWFELLGCLGPYWFVMSWLRRWGLSCLTSLSLLM